MALTERRRDIMLKFGVILLLVAESASLFLGFLLSFTALMLIPYGGEERYFFTSYWFRYYSGLIIVSNVVLGKYVKCSKKAPDFDLSKRIFATVCFQSIILLCPLFYSLFFDEFPGLLSLAMSFAVLHVFPFMLISPAVMIVIFILIVSIRVYLMWNCFPWRIARRVHSI